MIPDTPEQLHHKEASELQSNVSGTYSELWVSKINILFTDILFTLHTDVYVISAF